MHFINIKHRFQKTFVEDCISHRTKVNNGELPQYHVENNHPAIIDKGTWNRVQEELARRGCKRKVKEVGTKTELGKYSSKFGLTELLVCGVCGKPYRRVTWSRNGQKKIVWRCISRLDYGKKYCKDSPTLEESAIQTAVLEALIGQARAVPAALDVLKRHIGMGLSGDNATDGDPYAVEARLTELTGQIRELLALDTQDGAGGAYADRFEAMYTERNALKAKLEEIRAAANHASAEQSRLDEIFTVTNGVRNHPLEWSEQTARQSVEYVRVMTKDRLAVKFRFGDEVEIRME